MTALDFVIIGVMFLASLTAGGAITYLLMVNRQAKTERTADKSVEQPSVSAYWSAEATDDC